MGDTSIQWTDKTWNPVRGCSRVSEGCRHCYAERQAARFSGPHRPFDGFVRIQTGIGPQWTGKVELIESHLTDPLHWKKPQRVFVNSMSDLFHEGLDDEVISAVFAVMSQSPQHTFQILTKRPKRMLEWFSRSFVTDGVEEAGITRFPWCHANTEGRWPLPNVWLGVSPHDQPSADAMIPLLMRVPAFIRFISYEPALGPLDIADYLGSKDKGELDWVIVGGESGPNARPFNLDWARSMIAQCRDERVACFIKQLGSRPFSGHSLHKKIHHRSTDGNLYLKLSDRKGGDPEEWPEDLRVREFPGTANAHNKARP